MNWLTRNFWRLYWATIVGLLAYALWPQSSHAAVTGEWRVNLLKGSSTVSPPSVGATQEAAWAACLARIPASAATATTYRCQTPVYVAVVSIDPPTPPTTSVVWSTTVGAGYTSLVGARVSGAISVRLAGDCSTAFGSTGPWTFSVDDVARNTESQCPYALIDDNALFDTVALTNGSHTIKAVSGATTVSATFTVANAPPPPATGSATLTWIAPTTNTDGSALTNLAGYRICRGSNATTLTDCRPHMFPTATTATWTGLASGTHWFAVKAVNAAGAESVLSNAISKVVP